MTMPHPSRESVVLTNKDGSTTILKDTTDKYYAQLQEKECAARNKQNIKL